MMTCESVREELVAYRDGELPEHDRERIAEHLKTCLVCHCEEAQLARTEQLLVTMARIPPSQDFAATFWKRLEQENMQPRTAPLETISRPELSFVRWWREVREIFNASQAAPALAAMASLLIFFGYFFLSSKTRPAMETPAPVLAPATQELAKASPPALPPEVPTDLSERLAFYSNYNLIADLDRFAYFEDIAALEISTENATEIVKEENLPPELLQDPSFFAHYPILQQMDKLQNLEAVLDAPPTEGDSRGQG